MVSRRKFDIDELLLEAADQIKEQTVAPNIKKYKPHEKQFKFHKSTKKRKLYIGGNRSGKTVGGVCEGIWRATKTHPYRPELNSIIGPTRGRVVGVDFTQGIDKIIIPQYKQWCPPEFLRGGSWDAAYDRNSRTLHFKNRSTIEFMSYDQDLDKFAGTSRHWIHFDEEPPRPIWVECLARLVDTAGEFWITMTPVEGMTWVYDDIYEGNVGNPDGTVEIIEINTFENPYLTEEGIQGLLDVIDADDKTARIGGQFVTVGGRIYKNFDPTPGHGQVLSEPIYEPKRVFDQDWLWIMALDHGVNNPTAVLWLAFDPNGFGVVFDEYYQAERSVPQNAAAIKQKIKEHGRFPDLLVADPATSQRQGGNLLNIRQEYSKYGLNFKAGNNDVKAGLVRVRKYFDKYPYISSGVSRPEIFGGPPPRSDPSMWKPPSGDANNLYRLRISPKCVKLIWELKRYRYQTYTNKKLQFERNPYEEPNKRDDHACDALRYAIMTRPDLVGRNTHTSLAQAKELMNSMDQKLALAGNGQRIDDPNLRLATGWMPGDNEPSPEGDNWTLDEHMGGLY